MEFLLGAVLALVAWLLWNGLKPPGATVKSSLERDRRRADKHGDNMLKVMIAGVTSATATLAENPVLAVALGV